MFERRSIAARITYRPGEAGDLDAIANIEAASYSTADKGLSPFLLSGPAETLSHIACNESGPVGHLLLTRIDGPDRALALAPLAIRPEWRDMQIGTELVRHALTHARETGWRSVFAIGEPDYYRRFGFRSDLADAALTPWQGPRLMALELTQGALQGWSGPLAFPDDYEIIVRALLPDNAAR